MYKFYVIGELMVLHVNMAKHAELRRRFQQHGADAAKPIIQLAIGADGAVRGIMRHGKIDVTAMQFNAIAA